MPIQIETCYTTGVAIATLPSRVVVANAQELKRDIAQTTSNSQVKRVILDLSGVEFMDSSGIGLLVSLLKSMRAVGGDVILREPGGNVRMLLDLTRLSQVFTITSKPEPKADRRVAREV